MTSSKNGFNSTRTAEELAECNVPAGFESTPILFFSTYAAALKEARDFLRRGDATISVKRADGLWALLTRDAMAFAEMLCIEEESTLDVEWQEREGETAQQAADDIVDQMRAYEYAFRNEADTEIGTYSAALEDDIESGWGEY
ncbi:hypothetical protein [Congregibacter litoralis]|uniref:Uncharacterized protein n=1 Tax=Congregibacter litoralis KT71 TaxID=314285 RepID=A4A392_9GAMM|nr:hypothetical protein [Congregibacter litoralis]EAQ99165.2 hypothetical protein KT71_15886 [Congregibacter litoralis KT71]